MIDSPKACETFSQYLKEHGAQPVREAAAALGIEMNIPLPALLGMTKESLFRRYRLSKTVDDSEEDVMERLDIHRAGKNVAYLSYRPVSTEGDGPWISGLYVSPEHRGKGLAARLMRQMERRNPGATIRLRARPYKDQAVSSSDLMKIYSAMGYESYDPETPSRMKKAVPPSLFQSVRSRAPMVDLPRGPQLAKRMRRWLKDRSAY